jgi:outer membrane protein assembly factor BamA
MIGRPTPTRIAALLLFLFFFSAASILRAQSDPSYRPRLTGIIVEGQHKFKESTIAAASGLVVGKPTSLQDIATAAGRLATLGVFKKVRYQYSNTPDEISVQFHVDEETDLLPCYLDNFVWFTNEELIADLREHVPFFDVVLPPAGDILDQIRTELAKLLTAKNIPAQAGFVAYTAGIGKPVSALIFQATGIALPIRGIHFAGVDQKFLGSLSSASKELLHQDFSRLTIREYEHGFFLPVYQEKGYLRADFGEPTVESVVPGKTAASLEVTVLIPVVEGRAYKWKGAEWHGVHALPTDKLIESLGQKTGEPANLPKFDRGVDAARGSYEKSGYLEAEIQVKQIFQESDGTVAFDISVIEGEQFRMGGLEISGLPVAATDTLRKAWKLKPGEIFDESYFAEFVSKEVPPRLNRLGIRAVNVRESRKLDRENHRVDITLNF